MSGLISTARKLARAGPARPAQADLKRAVSTAYYAMFHALARNCADLFVGAGRNRSKTAWTQVYRALEHGPAKAACSEVTARGFPAGIRAFGSTFVRLQEERHRADYDPDSRYTRADVLTLIQQAEQAIVELRQVPEPDRRAFAVLVLFRKPRKP